MADFVARSNLFAPQGVGRPEIGDTGNPIPVREWEQNYYKPRDPEIVARGAPGMRGELYVPEPPVDPSDIVPKSYVDGLMAGEGVLSNPWQPYIVGNLIMGNWMTTMAGAVRTRPSAYLSLLYLSDTYYFDRASCHTWIAGGVGATAHLGIYEVDPDTLLPTSLKHDYGTADISATGQHDILLAPPRAYGPGHYGLCIQNEGGTANPAFTFEMSGLAVPPSFWMQSP